MPDSLKKKSKLNETHIKFWSEDGCTLEEARKLDVAVL
jgi:hypothetical protein